MICKRFDKKNKIKKIENKLKIKKPKFLTIISGIKHAYPIDEVKSIYRYLK